MLYRDELKQPFQQALHAVIEAIEGIRLTLSAEAYDAPTVITPREVGERLYKLNRG